MKPGTLKYKEYEGSVQYSAEDHLLHGKVLGIRGLLMYEGSSLAELEQDFHDAVEEYLDSCEANGDEPEKPFKGTFNVRVGGANHRNLAMEAMQKGISLNALLTNILTEHYRVIGWVAD